MITEDDLHAARARGYLLGKAGAETLAGVEIRALLQEKERLRKTLYRLLTEADEHNARYGKPERLCIYCPTRSYDGREGLVHSKDCAIREARATLEGPNEEAK